MHSSEASDFQHDQGVTPHEQSSMLWVGAPPSVSGRATPVPQQWQQASTALSPEQQQKQYWKLPPSLAWAADAVEANDAADVSSTSTAVTQLNLQEFKTTVYL